VNIIIFTHELTNTGASFLLIEVLLNLHKKNNLTIYSHAGGINESIFRKYNINYVINPGVLYNASFIASSVKKADIVIANTFLAGDVAVVCGFLNVPCVWWIHEGTVAIDLVIRLNNHNKLNYKYVVLFISGSRYLKQFQRTIGNKNIWSNFIGLPKLPVKIKEQKTNPNKIKLLFIGSIEENKGQFEFIQNILKINKSLLKKITVTFAGSAIDNDYYSKCRNMTFLSPNIYWLGDIDRDRVYLEMSQSDILLCMSKEETGPMVVLEGLSLGLCVISTNVGIVTELIHNGRNGIILDSVHSIISVLNELLKDVSKIDELKNAASKSVKSLKSRESFTIEVSDFIEYYACSHKPSRSQVRYALFIFKTIAFIKSITKKLK